jgi:hypothetical protein
MLDIHWRCGFGYGDFVTGLGYAHTSSLKYKTPTHITFHWNHSEDYKESIEDPETIIDRMQYVYSTMRKLDNVEVSYKVNSNFPYRFVNNLDEFNPLHGLWYTNLDTTNTNMVVLWRSKYNTYFPGEKKDPAHDRWDSVISYLQHNGYTVKEVTYRTPICEVLDCIRQCRFGIGYDGMVHQLFKYMWKPLIVMCKRHNLNRLLVPTASLEHNVDNLFKKGVEVYVNESKARCIRYNNELEAWLDTYSNPTMHSLYNKPNG